ncbi:DUF3238 domain-containing protein [Bacillus tropicus]|uniref:DUF3238 domain-containing protein n=1 Tax=Bacillus tropicus TaxID=2026188 RepID=UPI001CFD9FC6|nr:DUF3238 domain-containing protein [Bacillus tropicus]
MKKLFSFLLFVFVIFSANNISFADEVIPFNKSFFAYNEPSFTSAKGNGGAQYGPQKALTVKEKRSDGWWKIGTWEGDKWINTDGEKKKIEKPYITFAEPKFSSPKGNNGNVIAPQVVTVIDGQEDGWLKIQTNEGDKWIYPNAEAIKVDQSFYAYKERAFTSTKEHFGPQKSLLVKEKRQDGWWKIATYAGDKWINLTGEQKKIEKPYITFAEPKFTSPKGNNGNVIAPQVVTVIDGQEDGWLKIQTNEGDKWIFLNSEAVKVDKNFYAYNAPSFTSEKASGGNQYGPQKSLVVKEKRANGWWKIATFEGDKWVNLDGELKAFDKPFLAFYEPSFASQKGNMEIPYSSNTTVRVIDGNTKGWLKFQSWEGDKWMYPGVAETVAVNKNFYVYNEPSFISAKGNGANQFPPQKFLAVMEKRQDGWWKVVTYEGPKWVALNGAKMDISNNLYYAYNEPSYSSDYANGGMPYGPQTVKVLEEIPNGWLKISTWEGDKWINLIGEKVCKKINSNVQRASISKAALADNEKQLNANGENVNVVSSVNKIDLSWNKRNIVSKYKLNKLNDDGKWEEIWNGTETQFSATNLEPSNVYTLKLISYDSNGNVLNESKINAFTLKDKDAKLQYSEGLRSTSKADVSRAATDESKVVYPMADAYINSVESGGTAKLTWGNVPADNNAYEVYRDGEYVTTTTKNEFIDTQRSIVQKANVSSGTSTEQDPYRTFYDVKSVKQLPSNMIEEKVAALKAKGITLTTHQKEELECEEKNLSTFVDKPGWSSMTKQDKSTTNLAAEGFYDMGLKFRYQTFIPDAYVDAPSYIPDMISDFRTFEGDNRKYFTYYSNSFRTRLDVTASWSYNGTTGSFNPAKIVTNRETGLTTGYKNDGTAVNGKANADRDLFVFVKSATSRQAQFIMKTASANPLVPGAPVIDAYAHVVVNRNGSGATAGYHDRAPNHEFYAAFYVSHKPQQIYNPATLHTSELSRRLKFTALFPFVPPIEFLASYPQLIVNE